MKIAVFDNWRFKFTKSVVDYWRAAGHEVRAQAGWGPEIVEWADACYFYPVDNNLIQASRKQQKPPGTRIVAEAVDIDIYSNHPGAVKWDYVDALVVMSPHMLAVLREKVKLPESLPVHIVPGGVDLERFTLRQKPRGYNVAWIGRRWIAKNVFGALQIFNQLITCDKRYPWRLFLRADNAWDPRWWGKHVEAYFDANPELARRTEFVPHQKDLNGWLEDIDFLLQTSFKEAFGYVVAECAAKGIRPVVQMTNGALDLWPWHWVFQTHGEAVHALMSDYVPEECRGFIAEHYPLEARLRALDRIMGVCT